MEMVANKNIEIDKLNNSISALRYDLERETKEHKDSDVSLKISYQNYDELNQKHNKKCVDDADHINQLRNKLEETQ